MSDYERIRVLFCDHLNLARGKYVPRAAAENGSLRHCVGVYAVDYERALIPAPGSGVPEGLPDMEATFDLDRVRPGWEPGTGVVVADLEKEGQPLGLCARGALARADRRMAAGGPHSLPRHRARGLRLRARFRRRLGALRHPRRLRLRHRQRRRPRRPGRRHLVAGAGLRLPAGGDQLRVRLAAVRVHAALPGRARRHRRHLPVQADGARGRGEAGLPAQLHAEAALRIAAAAGSTSTSASPTAGGDNAFADPAQEDGLSELARRCIAGLMHHHRAMAGLIAPTVNSYRRLRPASLAGYWANWGYDHRGVAVRVPGERGPATRIEHRVADGAANPYVAAADDAAGGAARG